MGKTSYKSTSDLIQHLTENIEKLNNGELSLNELDDLVNNGRELYEQLVVLRYKAFDQYGEPQTNDEIKEEIAEPVQEVIEPETEAEPEVIEEEATESSEPTFDFTGFGEAEETEEEEPEGFDFTIKEEAEEAEPEVNAEPEIKMEEETEEEESEAEPSLFQTDEESNSLNEILKNEEELSLRKKLQKTPVEDLKSHISIAKKFEYISSMFDGNSEAYNDAIELLNSCTDGDIARQKLNEYTSQYNWDLENKSIIKFIELVERRYI